MSEQAIKGPWQQHRGAHAAVRHSSLLESHAATKGALTVDRGALAGGALAVGHWQAGRALHLMSGRIWMTRNSAASLLGPWS